MKNKLLISIMSIIILLIILGSILFIINKPSSCHFGSSYSECPNRFGKEVQ